MARIRSIHPGLFTDEGFMNVSAYARLLFMGIWTEADDQGVFEWKPIRLKIRILPADNTPTPELLGELVKHNLIRRFEDGGREFGAVRNFRKWQRPKMPQALYPLPPEIAAYVRLVDASNREKPERGNALGRMLAERQNHRCYYCETEITFYRKKPNSLEIDHRVPVSRGGDDHVANLVASCRKCNSLKATMTDVEFREKFAASELRERHSSQSPKDQSQVPKNYSHPPKSATREATFQMEEGGDSRESPFRALSLEEPKSPPIAEGALPQAARPDIRIVPNPKRMPTDAG